MAESGCRRNSAPIKTLTPAALALGLAALVAGTAPGKGGYWKSQCDLAKNQITSMKTQAQNNKIAAYNASPKASSARAAAVSAHNGKTVGVGGWTQEKENSYQAALKSGDAMMAQGVNHRNAAEWRYNEGTSKYLAGDSFYTAYNYTAAYPEYTQATEPIGSLQHFQFARNDWGSELQCYNSAKTTFDQAAAMCQ